MAMWRGGNHSPAKTDRRCADHLHPTRQGPLWPRRRRLPCQRPQPKCGHGAVRYGPAYRKYSDDYTGQEMSAKVGRRGLWAGQFIPPWEWRRGKRLASETAANGNPPGCRIKGNIGSKGDRIYHMPGGRWYDRTVITASKGERWFCSEGEAKAAGWRRAGMPAFTMPRSNTGKSPAMSEPAKACCKVCRKGQACGNSCNSRQYTCRKPVGCACNN